MKKFLMMGMISFILSCNSGNDGADVPGSSGADSVRNNARPTPGLGSDATLMDASNEQSRGNKLDSTKGATDKTRPTPGLGADPSVNQQHPGGANEK